MSDRALPPPQRIAALQMARAAALRTNQMAKLQTLKPRLQNVGSRLKVVESVSWRTDKQTSAQRGYGYKWQQARAAYLRAHPLCAYCEREGKVTAATIVDHRIPHRGDMTLFWDESNWQSLCATHHSRNKQREEAQDGNL